MMNNTLTPTPGMPQDMVENLEVASIAARANLDAVRAKHEKQIEVLKTQLVDTMSARTPAKLRLIRIRHIAGEQSGLFSRQTACSRGCSHCCHIGVDIPRSEAKIIAKLIDKPMTEPHTARSIDEPASDQYVGQPCSFLLDGTCSIYSARPLMCRTLVNLDSSSKLCELVPGAKISVPYLNNLRLQGAFALVSQSEDFADIREWFPKP
jgi:Fe-S-cluster containining protein